FTKSASVAGIAGIFLIFYALEQKKVSFPAYFAGLILACFGVMYRWRQFFACAALMTGIGVFLLLKLREYQKQERLRRFLTYVGGFGVLLGAAIGLIMLDNHMYNTDSAWSYYREYNLARANLLDYGFPDYEENRSTYEALGINEDAFHMYVSCNFNDPEKFSLDTMKTLIGLKEKTRLSKALIVQFLQKFPLNFFQTAAFYCFLLLGFLWLLWGSHKWSGWLTVFYEICAFGAVYFYMFYRGRYLVNRVDAGLWFGACTVLIWLLQAEKAKASGQTASLLCLSAVLLNQSSMWKDWRINAGPSADLEQRAVLEEMSQDKEHLYLAKVGTISESSAYGIFDAMPKGLVSNINWLGGWETNSAGCIAALADYDVVNPFRDMINNEKVYLIDNNIKLTMRYINEFYDETAEAVKVKKVGEYQIYQIKSK
ncbi:MAG: hypothetical protein PHE06_11370, partial [Lachnospiraceae bacterium]|nr:hypothetical protein [Lachnospiraceae bacterium]